MATVAHWKTSKNTTFESVQKVRDYLIAEMPKACPADIEVWPITDWMDRVNDCDNDANYDFDHIWFGYVQIVPELEFTAVFNVKRYDNIPHYQGIIFLDGSSKCQFGQVCEDYEAFMEWLNEKCATLANGKQFKVVDLVINHEQFEKAYCYG